MVKNPAAQNKYRSGVEYDEYLMGMNGQLAKKTEVHEILFGSRRTFENWNMIALCNLEPYYHHSRAHNVKKPLITERELFIAKIRLGHPLPPERVCIEFNLMDNIRFEFNKFPTGDVKKRFR